jgi:streptomycin 6-kinase
MIHPGLEWAHASLGGREWLERLPRIVDGCAERWSLRLGPPFPYAYASLALPATLPDRSRAVLKIQFPDRESEHEAAALARWNGEGAVRLLAHDADRRALLLEHCQPGTPLSEMEQDAALDVMIGLLPRLWLPAGAPFHRLADEAGRWVEDLPRSWQRAEQPFDRRLLHRAVDALRTLLDSQGEQVLLDQDLHAGNVLRAAREPWLVIDPKPLVGEREFGIAALVRGDELGRGPDLVRYRLDRLTRVLDLDRERARDWALAHTLAWAFEGDEALPLHVETAGWLAALG